MGRHFRLNDAILFHVRVKEEKRNDLVKLAEECGCSLDSHSYAKCMNGFIEYKFTCNKSTAVSLEVRLPKELLKTSKDGSFSNSLRKASSANPLNKMGVPTLTHTFIAEDSYDDEYDY